LLTGVFMVDFTGRIPAEPVSRRFRQVKDTA